MTIASLVWAMSEMTPSVMMRRTKYWDPSSTVAAELGGPCVTPEGTGTPPRGTGPLLPSNVVDNRGEVGGAVELDTAQAALICLQHPRNAAARWV